MIITCTHINNLVLVSCYEQTRYTLDGFQQALTAPQALLERVEILLLWYTSAPPYWHCTLIKLLWALLVFVHDYGCSTYTLDDFQQALTAPQVQLEWVEII